MPLQTLLSVWCAVTWITKGFEMATIVTNFSSKSSLIAAIKNIDTSEFTSSFSSLSNIDSNWSVNSSSNTELVLKNLDEDLFSLSGSFASSPYSVTSMNLETSSGGAFKINGAFSISSAGVISGYSSSMSLTTDSSSVSLSGKLYLFTDGVTSSIRSMKVTSTQWSLELGGDFQSSDLSTESMSKANITSLSMTYNGNKFSISNISLNALTEFNSTTDTDFDESFFQRMLSGSDLINGGAGNDWLIGYGGKDTLDGGAGSDTADYSDKTTDVVVNLNKSANATVYVNGAAEDTIKNIENITGGSGADQLTGDALTNTFIGGSGNDVIDGGADTAADIIDGGAGTDTISFASITGTTGVTFALGTYNASNKATAQTVAKIGATSTDKVSNVENITGSKNADVLAGNDSNNVISGGAGADTLTGGKGLDKLYGGINDGVKDIFDFNAANESTSAAMDLIYDFVSSKDKIDLSSMTPSTNNKGAFLNNPATALGTTYKANSVWITKYDTSGTANDYVIVSADLNGKAGADFAVKLIGINNIVTADILL